MNFSEFETILTTVELERKDKKSYLLPSEENERIEKILKKAQDKEAGKLTDVSLTEDNPDGRKCKNIHFSWAGAKLKGCESVKAQTGSAFCPQY